VFREFGPLSGSTVRAMFEYAPGGTSGLLGQHTFDLEARYYQRLFGTGVFAVRARGFRSAGPYPTYTYFGGVADMRGYDYLQFIGQNAFYSNAELRFPIIEAMLTPLGVLGGVRGVFFFDIGAGWYDNTGFKFATSSDQVYRPQVGIVQDPSGNLVPIYGDPVTISGFRLVDSRASYGIGLETFVLGLPMHFDWAWRTMFNKQWETYVYGSSSAFRHPKFQFWIGYDW
jgi:outer membrane protein assembly factor BamA